MEVYRYDPLWRLWLTQQSDLSTDTAAQLAGSTSAGILIEHLRWMDSTGNYEAVTNPYRYGDPFSWTRTRNYPVGRMDVVDHFSGCNSNAPNPPTIFPACPATSGAAVTSYNYNATTMADEAGKSKIVTTDALGRITSVQEDPTGLNYSTQYAYDALDDLTQVSQGSQTRSFSYNNVKRLINAANPESGTINYSSYDLAGNLLSKQDANGVTTTYTYDALNRITSKSYTTVGGVTTPSVAYGYDLTGAICSLANYPVGHLRSVTATTTDSVTLQTLYNCYDPYGGVTQSTQTTDGQTYTFGAGSNPGYSYNLAGGLIGMTYPSGRALTYGYDSAGRAQNVQSGILTPYATVSQYAAHGAPSRMTQGNALKEQHCYNDRLEMSSLRVGSAAFNNDCSNQSGDSLAVGFGYGTSNNNGNLLSQNITVGSAMGYQQFQYDGVNRLLTVDERTTSAFTPSCPDGGSVWCQQYGYDATGNRTVSQSSIPVGAWNVTSFNAANNRIADANWGYDAAGNITQDLNGNKTLTMGRTGRWRCVRRAWGRARIRWGQGRRCSGTMEKGGAWNGSSRTV